MSQYQRPSSSRPERGRAEASAGRFVAELTGEGGIRVVSTGSVLTEIGSLPNKQFLVGELSALVADAAPGARVAQCYLVGTMYHLRAFVCVGEGGWSCYERTLRAPVSDERKSDRRSGGDDSRLVRGNRRLVRGRYEWV